VICPTYCRSFSNNGSPDGDEHEQRDHVMTAVTLHRIDPARNMSRFYRLDLKPDLFGTWGVVRERGRIGRPGRGLTRIRPRLKPPRKCSGNAPLSRAGDTFPSHHPRSVTSADLSYRRPAPCLRTKTARPLAWFVAVRCSVTEHMAIAAAAAQADLTMGRHLT